MNKMFTVFKFELKNALKSGAFIFSTLFLVAMIIIGSLFFKFTSGNIESVPKDPEAISESRNIGVIIEDNALALGDLKKIYKNDELTEFTDIDELKSLMKEKEIDAGIIFTSLKDIKVITGENMMMGIFTDYSEPIKNYLLDQELQTKGMTIEELKGLENNVVVNVKAEFLNPISPFSYIISMILSVVIYIMVIMNGTISATSVAREKSDRSMELLITSTAPNNLINGKVMASFAQGVLSILSYVIALLFGYLINRESINALLTSMDIALDPMIIIIFLLFFIFGYTLYLYIYAALGATVSKVEEVNVAVTPIMLIVVLVYFGTIYAYSDPNGSIMKILSYIPFSSPFTMHARYALSNLSMNEVWISLGILIVTTIILSFLSTKLYRNASLNYGNNKFLNRIKKIFGRKK